MLVSLTEPGADLVASRRERYEKLWSRAFADFSAEELETATAVLERTREIFDEMAAAAEHP